MEMQSHQRCCMKKGVLRNVAQFTGQHFYKSFFFNKVADLRPATLLTKRLWHRCSHVKFAKFLRHLFHRTPLGDCFWGWLKRKWKPFKNDIVCNGVKWHNFLQWSDAIYISDESHFQYVETVVRRWLVKRLFLKFSQYSQENTCIG